jgi:hypothetical protein
MEADSVPHCTSGTYPDCVKEAKTSGVEDWIPRDGPTNISGMPDNKSGYKPEMTEKQAAQKELDEANKGVEKVKDDEQKSKNEKLYPKKKE